MTSNSGFESQQFVNGSAPLIEVRSLSKFYGGLAAVSELSFEVMPGETFGIAGPNGAGKTTLFDAITGMVKATSGNVSFGGVEIIDKSIYQVCRMGLARTFQSVAVFENATVLANATMGAHFGRGSTLLSDLSNNRDSITKAEEALAFVGLQEMHSEHAGSISIYDKKRLMIASALATKPTALFLDEPFGGLTPSEVDAVISLINEIKATGVTIVMIEHVMRALMQLSDRVLIMNHGKQLFLGRPDEVLKDEQVIKVYLGSESLIAHESSR